jgi:hypothetical protein
MITLRRMRWEGHVARMGRRGMHVRCSGKAKREETTIRPYCRCVNNIKMDLREIKW